MVQCRIELTIVIMRRAVVVCHSGLPAYTHPPSLGSSQGPRMSFLAFLERMGGWTEMVDDGHV
jgi:hypothetical protein